jgi:inorganic pyrophosphatase
MNNLTYIINIEVEKHSNQKYEYDKDTNTLILDRVLKYPYFYPYAYGYFPETLGNDGDELDILLITNLIYKTNESIECKIIGGLIMEDEKGMDEKIFVIPVNDKMYYNLKENEWNEICDNISWFFSNYKSKDINKWSKVHRLMTCNEAIELYNKSKLNYNKKKILSSFNEQN